MNYQQVCAMPLFDDRKIFLQEEAFLVSRGEDDVV